MAAELCQLADGVYAWIHQAADRFTCNVGVIVDDDALTLIDSSGVPSSYRSLDRELSRFGKRVRKIVLTHGHPDHVAGVGHFRPQEIVASESTVASLRSEPHIPALQCLHPSVATELATLSHPTPNRLIRESCSEGRLRFELLNGHTGGDLVVRIPDVGVTFAGDLCFFGTVPLGIGADFDAWARAIEQIAEWKGRIVPGHGRLGDAADAQDVQAYLREVSACARESRPMPDGPWSSWFDLWNDRIRGASHLINIEQAREPAKPPATLVDLIRSGASNA